MASATRLLNAAGFPFQAKVLSDPAAYIRADAGVIYIRRRDFPRVAEIIARVHDSVGQGLHVDVPLFTKQLADGLGIAEDPTDGSSFGEHRCRLVAEALWCGFTMGLTHRDARAEHLATAFRRGSRPATPSPPKPHGATLIRSRGATCPTPVCASQGPRPRVAPRLRSTDRPCPLPGGRLGPGGSALQLGRRRDRRQGRVPSVQALGYDLYSGAPGRPVPRRAVFADRRPGVPSQARGAIARSIRLCARARPARQSGRVLNRDSRRV